MIDIVFFGSARSARKSLCCGLTTDDELANGLIGRLYQLYGRRRVRCKYVDVNSNEMLHYPELLKQYRLNRLQLPAVQVEGVLVAKGSFSLGNLLTAIPRSADNPSPVSRPKRAQRCATCR